VRTTTKGGAASRSLGKKPEVRVPNEGKKRGVAEEFTRNCWGKNDKRKGKHHLVRGLRPLHEAGGRGKKKVKRERLRRQ